VDIGSWLQDLGLERYTRKFRDHEIDLDVLGDLTEADLEELGISLDHRKKLLRAIASLAKSEAADTAGPERGTERGLPASVEPSRVDAERRQLTVMFIELAGSTELSTRLDPEDMGALIRRFQNCCAAVLKAWGGHLARFMVDSALVYFGWPQAHEDDAERAVRAGLELAKAVADLSIAAEVRLATRTGIATGPVLVGDLTAGAAAQDDVVVGETPNLAARLQTLAVPGTVVVAERTRRLLGGLFAFADLGPVRLKGFTGALAAFRVEGEGGAEGRFEALRGRRLTPLVDREHELAILMERWAWAREGDGQVVLLEGEPGIGKSRLIRALRDELSGEPHVTLSHFCSPNHTNSALYPIISQLERAAGLASDDGAEGRLAKLEALLRQATDRLDEAVPLIAPLLGIPAGDRYPVLSLSPQRRKQRTLEVLMNQLTGLARDRPVLVLYDDLHWVDLSTLELLSLVVEDVRTLPVLMVLNYRPEFSAPWTGKIHVAALPLNRLGQRHGAAMVTRLTGRKALPNEVLGQIIAKTDGVPLFIEELTKTVLESDLVADHGDHYELRRPLSALAIPDSLQDSLTARLDRLGRVKEVAQIAAVIGRDFSYELLAAIAPLPEAELRAALARLVETEFLYCRGAPPDALYTFKHALVQETAYNAVLRGRRQQLHARIGRTLAADFPEVMKTRPELVAYHCTEGGLDDEAVELWRAAGELAMSRSAAHEAVAHLTSALEALARLPASGDRNRTEIGLQTDLGAALIAARGFAAPETGRAYGRAWQLCREQDLDAEHLPVLFGRWIHYTARAELDAGLEVAKEMRRLAEAQGDTALSLIAYRALANTKFFAGDLVGARTDAERALASYDRTHHSGLGVRYSADPVVLCAYFLAHSLLRLGYPDQALPHARAALARARELGHGLTLANALHHDCLFHQLRRDPVAVRDQALALTTFATEHGLPFWQALGRIFRGWALACSGQLDKGVADLRIGLAKYRATSGRLYLPYALALLADACHQAGEREAGLVALTEAHAVLRETGVRGSECHIHRTEGRLSLLGGEPDVAAAERCFGQAISVARRQEARLSELRAAVDLARLRRDQGRRRQAYDLLAPLYRRFSEGFDTADLKEAQALLGELD
jgi:class 3 adenylate cyclase/predicted ATPase